MIEIERNPITGVRLMQLQAGEAYRELLASLEDLTEAEAWAMPDFDGRADLYHGPVIGLIHHVASCKMMYASAAFRDGEYRWDDCRAWVAKLGMDVTAGLDFLADSQRYWLDSWADLPDSALAMERCTNWGERWPAWRIIHSVTQHDAYHAGQINAFRAMLRPALGPPLQFVD